MDTEALLNARLIAGTGPTTYGVAAVSPASFSDQLNRAVNFRTWPIATFRCDTELGRNRRHSGHRVSRANEDAPSTVQR